LYQRPLYLSAATENFEDEGLPSSGIHQPQSTSSIYVNRGIGTIGAPVRLGVPPEITLITLRKAV
jgi:predicted MPP superfamily phosphohydrolase